MPFSRIARKRKKAKEHKIRKRKGKASYRKGKEFEKKAYSFLSAKGFRVFRERLRFKGGEFDGFASKNGRKYAVEAKNTKQKVSANVVKRLKKKIAKSAGVVKGGIIVSRSGFTEEAWAEERKDMLLFKYKQGSDNS